MVSPSGPPWLLRLWQVWDDDTIQPCVERNKHWYSSFRVLVLTAHCNHSRNYSIGTMELRWIPMAISTWGSVVPQYYNHMSEIAVCNVQRRLEALKPLYQCLCQRGEMWPAHSAVPIVSWLGQNALLPLTTAATTFQLLTSSTTRGPIQPLLCLIQLTPSTTDGVVASSHLQPLPFNITTLCYCWGNLCDCTISIYAEV